jgi:hypothetical protein
LAQTTRQPAASKQIMKAKARDLKLPYLTISLTVLSMGLSLWGGMRCASVNEPDHHYIAAQMMMAGMFSLTGLLTLAAWGNRLTDAIKELKSMIWELEGKVSRLKAAQAQVDKPNP